MEASFETTQTREQVLEFATDAYDGSTAVDDLNWMPCTVEGRRVAVAVASGRHAEAIQELLREYWNNVNDYA